MNENHVEKYIENISTVRGVPKESLNDYKQMMVGDLVKGPRAAHIAPWSARQAYISMGAFMTAASLLHIDVCPMEGFDPTQYDEILSLKNSEYTSVAVMAAGYRAADDGYQYAKKVRKEKKDLIKIV